MRSMRPGSVKMRNSAAGQEEDAVEKGALAAGPRGVPGESLGVDGKIAGLDQGLDRRDDLGHVGQVG